jgi:hypothetical protein
MCSTIPYIYLVHNPTSQYLKLFGSNLAWNIIFINPSRVFDQKICMQNAHFLLDKPNKPTFHKNLDLFFSMYPYTHVGKTLFIKDTPYKNFFNMLFSAIFLEYFDDVCGKDHYLLGIVFLYLESLHLFEFDVSTFVQHSPKLVGLNVLITMILNNIKCYL